MNEKIKELSAIAKSLTTDEAIHLSRIHNRTLSLDELGEIHDQKFADLIIKECIEIVEPCKCGCCDGEPEGIITDTIIKQIKKHFGVEE